jgi:hypothetical protein
VDKNDGEWVIYQWCKSLKAEEKRVIVNSLITIRYPRAVRKYSTAIKLNGISSRLILESVMSILSPDRTGLISFI